MSGSGAATLVGALANNAMRRADHLAVDDGERALTYGELARVTDDLAGRIVGAFGQDAEPVGVLLDQGLDAVIALFGVLKAGKIALPLDNSLPSGALETIVSHAGARLVLTDVLDPMSHEPAPPRLIAPDDPAAIYYTSGSTGRAKGFVISHDGQLRGTRSSSRAFGLQQEDRVALLFHYSFGAARVSLYGALASGATLHVYNVRRAGLPSIARALEDDRITFAHCAPSLLRSLLSQLPEGPNLSSLRLLATGAEGLERRDIARFRRHVWPGCTLAYSYAVSEVGPVAALMIDSTIEFAAGPLPIGDPMPGKRVTIADPDADGTGEIIVAGDGLASGYWDNEHQTAERFGVDHDGVRFFRTGDRGRIRPDGLLEYRGRIGTVVKVRGFSVDVADIERALHEIAPLEEVAVVLDHRGRRRLVAHLVPDASHPRPDPGQLRPLLADRLAPYMIPSAFVFHDALPRTNRGKIDRAALPPPPAARPELETPFLAPRDDLERSIAATWETTLEVRPVGVHDDFFQLGGDSLLAAESVSALQDALGREIPLAAFLETATVAGMAELLRRGGEKEWASPLVPLRTDGSRPAFFCVHGAGGNVMTFRPLADRLDDQPFYALQLFGAPARRALRRVERLAAHYVDEVRRAQPQGPHILGGFSFGGAVAFEMARQLAAAGDPPALVVLLDSMSPYLARDRLHGRPVKRMRSRLKLEWKWFWWKVGWARWRVSQTVLPKAGGSPWKLETKHGRLTKRAMRRYHPGTYDGRVVLLRRHAAVTADLGWGDLVTGELEVIDVNGEHESLLAPPHVDLVAHCLATAITQALQPSS